MCDRKDWVRLSCEEKIRLYNEAMNLRKKYGWGKRRIAKALGLDPSLVGNWIRRGSKPFSRWNKPNLEPSPELSFVVGVILGDGSVYYTSRRYNIRLDATDKSFVEEFSTCLAKVLKKEKPYRIQFKKPKGKRSPVWVVQARSRMFYEWFKSGKWREVARRFPREFLRGFYLSEGSFEINKHRNNTSAIKIYNKDLEKLRFVQEILKLCGFKSDIHKGHNAYFLHIHGGHKKNLEFLNFIGVSPQCKLFTMKEPKEGRFGGCVIERVE